MSISNKSDQKIETPVKNDTSNTVILSFTLADFPQKNGAVNYVLGISATLVPVFNQPFPCYANASYQYTSTNSISVFLSGSAYIGGDASYIPTSDGSCTVN